MSEVCVNDWKHIQFFYVKKPPQSNFSWMGKSKEVKLARIINTNCSISVNL